MSVWITVPSDPTEEMIEAGAPETCGGDMRDNALGCYKAMIAAAPRNDKLGAEIVRLKKELTSMTIERNAEEVRADRAESFKAELIAGWRAQAHILKEAGIADVANAVDECADELEARPNQPQI